MPHDSPAGEFDEPIRWAPRISHRPIPTGFPEYAENALLPNSAVYKVQRFRRRASLESVVLTELIVRAISLRCPCWLPPFWVPLMRQRPCLRAEVFRNWII